MPLLAADKSTEKKKKSRNSNSAKQLYKEIQVTPAIP